MHESIRQIMRFSSFTLSCEFDKQFFLRVSNCAAICRTCSKLLRAKVRSSRQATVPTKFVRLLSMTSKCEYTDFLISSDDDVAFESNPNVVSFISSSSASD
jgi:hypothetical protein